MNSAFWSLSLSSLLFPYLPIRTVQYISLSDLVWCTAEDLHLLEPLPVRVHNGVHILQYDEIHIDAIDYNRKQATIQQYSLESYCIYSSFKFVNLSLVNIKYKNT